MNKANIRFWGAVALRAIVIAPFFALYAIGVYAEKIADWLSDNLPNPSKGD